MDSIDSKESESKLQSPLRIAFLHPDLGIGGAERLVVDAALGLQQLGHHVDLYTSYHDPSHCFEETRDGTLKVHYIKPPFPRSLFNGKFHILLAHLRQLHLTLHILLHQLRLHLSLLTRQSLHPEIYDVYFVDQLSTCVPLLRWLGGKRVVFYCHFPDKLLANGAFVEGEGEGEGKGEGRKRVGWLKYLYRLPMDWLEEVTTRQADIILANSHFTARIFKSYFPSIKQTPRIVYPGINIEAYEGSVDEEDPDIRAVSSTQPTLLSLNRFEGKKNAMLALQSFALLLSNNDYGDNPPRLVLAGGYDHRLADNVTTLETLIEAAKSLSLSYAITSPKPLPPTLNTNNTNNTRNTNTPAVLFLLNFTTAQRTSLLLSPSTRALLYTPANEHFGIVPVEAMVCGVPVVACDSGGPTESVLDCSYTAGSVAGSAAFTSSSSSSSFNPSSSPDNTTKRTGFLLLPSAPLWSSTLHTILTFTPSQRADISETAKDRARRMFGMEAMARGLEGALGDAVGMGGVWSWSGGERGGGGGVGREEGDGWTNTVVMMLIGFLIAYLVGPFVLPS